MKLHKLPKTNCHFEILILSDMQYRLAYTNINFHHNGAVDMSNPCTQMCCKISCLIDVLNG